MDVAKRRGSKRAKVTLARKIAVILHRMWVDGTTSDGLTRSRSRWRYDKEKHDRGKSVAAMRKAHPNARFWLHQSKLIEGVDDPNFVAMALYDLMGNARQVIQQIGRMIRWKQRADKAQQSGFVLANEPNISRAKTIWAILEDVIAAIIKDGEKKARDAETEARRHELAVRREQERKQREQKREQKRGEVKR
jgi:hypothetical protein